MTRRVLRLFFLVSSLPVSALAADLNLSLEGDALYDSNVFRRENNVKDDVLLRIRPGVELREERGQDVNYSLGYEVPFQFSTQYGDELNDVDHFANGDIRYHVNDRLDVFASDGFRYLRSTVQLAETDPDAALAGQGVPILSTERDRVTLNLARAGASYAFAPRLSGNLVAMHQLFESTREDRQDNWAVTGMADLQYTLSAQHIVGAGVRYIYQEFDDAQTLADSNSNTYNGFLSWRYQVTETTAFSISAGPSYIWTKADPQSSFSATSVPTVPGSVNQFASNFANCPLVSIPGQGIFPYIPTNGCQPLLLLTAGDLATVSAANAAPVTVTNLNAQSNTDSTLTVFGEAALSKRWTPNLASAVRYERSQSNASGLGGTVTLDALSFATTWDFAERWQFAFRGDWTHRKSVADVTQIFTVVGPLALTNGSAAQLTGAAYTATLSNARIETNRWGIAGRLTHEIWRNTRIFGQVAYNQQDSKQNTLGAASDFDDFIATIGVRHVFEPIKVW